MAESTPRVLGGRYEVRSLIGRGGMAEVHLGFDKRLSRIVAIKTLRTDLAMDSVFQARFRREAQSAASLNHPNIVAVPSPFPRSLTLLPAYSLRWSTRIPLAWSTATSSPATSC